jgi:putative ABC transport system permease protein
MIRVTLKGIVGRRLRTALTALAIVLGVAMISGTYALTDRLFTGAYTGADAVISGKTVVETASSGDATVSAALLDRVTALPEVEAASGGIIDKARLVDRSGTPLSTRESAIGVSVDARPSARRFDPLRLTVGRWPAGPTETAVDAGTAKKHDLAVGEEIGVATRGPVRRFTITGVAKFTGLSSTGKLTLAIFDVPTAQALFHKTGRLDEIWAAGKDGVASESLVRALQPLVPAGGEVATGASKIKAESKGSDKQVAIVQKLLLAFGAIALFVGAFVIFNTFSITIAQRMRELATLRTLGASRRQVLMSVILESIAIGILGSVIGLFLGLGLDRGLAALSAAAGSELPDSGAVLATRTVVVCLLAGVLITLAAGLFPALRATRVPPVAAVREGATLPKSRLASYAPQIAAGLIALGAGVISTGLFAGGLGAQEILALLAAGCLLLFLGVAMVSSSLVRPLAAVVGWPAQRMGGAPGRLARENALRDPGRTAVTAAALMIYLALVTFVAVLGQGMRSSVSDGVDRVVAADYVVTADDNVSSLPRAVGEALASQPAAQTLSSVRRDSARAFGSDQAVDGLDPATIGDVVRLDWDAGSPATLAQLGADGAVLQRKFATDHDLRVGSRFAVESAQGRRLGLTVKGIYRPPGVDAILAPIGIARETFDASFERPQDAFTFISASSGVSAAAASALEAELRRFPEAELKSRSEFRDARGKPIRTALIVVYVLLAMTVIVSLLGMVNTLVLSLIERTRELGMLRAVGMTRRQLRRMIRHESVITALIGAALGLPLGLLLAALVTQALSDMGIAFAIPGVALAAFALTAILAGLLAAVLPARRAARLNVLDALHYE